MGRALSEEEEDRRDLKALDPAASPRPGVHTSRVRTYV